MLACLLGWKNSGDPIETTRLKWAEQDGNGDATTTTTFRSLSVSSLGRHRYLERVVADARRDTGTLHPHPYQFHSQQ